MLSLNHEIHLNMANVMMELLDLMILDATCLVNCIPLILGLIQHISKTHWATHRHQSSPLPHDLRVSFKSCLIVSIQFFLSLRSLFFVVFVSQCMTRFGSLLSSVCKTCPNQLGLLTVQTLTGILSRTVSELSQLIVQILDTLHF